MSAEDALEAADRLRDAGKLPEAIVHYKAAHAFAATPVTGFELGRAYAEIGALTEAYETLTGIASMMVQPGEPRAWNEARDEARVLAEQVKARTPAVRITLSGIAEGATFTVTIDGKTVRPETLGVARRLNPGHHIIAVHVERGGDARRELDLRERESREVPLSVTMPEASPETDDELHVSFVLPEHLDETERDGWVLHAPGGAAVCTLPCEPHVTPTAGYFFQLTRVVAGGSVDVRRVDMPATFTGLPPGHWYVVPHESRGNQLVAGLLLIPEVPATFIGVVGGGALIGEWANYSSNGAALAGGVALIGGIAALIAVHVYWLVWSRPAGVTIEGNRRGRSTFRLTPMGLSATF